MKFVKQLLFTLVCANIFFLTGCTSGRYHSQRVEMGQPVNRGWAPLTQAASFSWPAQGKVLVPFGQQEDGVSLKGIVISGGEGAVVSAAADGFVAYADPSLRGFGQTLVVDHRNGFSSVYARNAELLVLVGQEVRRGQPIARLGRSGKGVSPELYFEIRKNSKPEDPLNFLR